MLVVTPVAAPLDWLLLGKFLFPITQHMRLYAAQLADFTDREIAFGRDRWQGLEFRLGGPFVHRLNRLFRLPAKVAKPMPAGG